MPLPARKTVWRNTSLKLISLIFGFTFWYIFGNLHSSTAWITVPLCFYNIPQNCQLKGPDSISLKITGKRSDLRALDIEQLAIHINANRLKHGKNLLYINQDTIFLPDAIKLVHYCPLNPVIELANKEEHLDG